ncbi:MAG: HupE/UreJ family protein [Bacteroidota bacterium]
MKLRKYSFLIFLGISLIPLISYGHDVTSADKVILMNNGIPGYIYVGAKHMLTGYDHILFLVGVIFYLNNFKDILKFITVFTIGHSITLIGATYVGVTANEYLIDSVIALSVLYKGFENLDGFQKFFKIKSSNLLLMVFVFGLIHGFGLSARLQSFDIGEAYLLLKTASFNIGVELGQILALIPIVFLISKWRKYKSYGIFYRVTNVFLVVAGVLLFSYQIYGYFNPDTHHSHDHEHVHEGHDHSH